VLTFVDASRQAGRVSGYWLRLWLVKHATGRGGTASPQPVAGDGHAPVARPGLRCRPDGPPVTVLAQLWRGNARIYYRLALAFHPHPLTPALSSAP
jgi:hypothetical protein